MDYEEYFTKIKKVDESRIKVCIGNCITVFEDPVLQDFVAQDATELAQLVENGEKITKSDFLAFSSVEKEIFDRLNENPDRYEFYCNYDANVAWYYDVEEDVEYFYV